ncbi:SMI1/KNR4 family protein [Legionella worsleiensis]|uniref:SMI1 / KNR4 family protein n=1 Tax=Legionella worsleiensis TaxID=45076 RepID=A0A0W1AA98_9GAMM|nr:SMI1/KNR4 family protein [Legionella worsleiensis]KTD78216.1 SMI1 / KNR4 family protein [Legionella worsleiensis]STY32553.1 SMI1 / KNR4 family [Legionella worsleiensis]
MFDFNKLEMTPIYSKDFRPGTSDEQIIELEKHCGHPLPENYKYILKNYNGSRPNFKYFDVIDEKDGIPLEYELGDFYIVDENRNKPSNIWWVIQNFSEYLGPNTLPFADDGIDQVYYMKWVNNIPQVWHLVYQDLDEPETYCVSNSFDELLEALYNAD